ncbi:hypothetical protein CR513_02372, partial [Mucuna pruriens]
MASHRLRRYRSRSRKPEFILCLTLHSSNPNPPFTLSVRVRVSPTLVRVQCLSMGPSLKSSQSETKSAFNVYLCMTKSSSNILYELDPEIDRTLRRLWKVKSYVVSNSSNSNFVSNSNNTISATTDFDFFEYSSSDINPDPNLVVSNFEEP